MEHPMIKKLCLVLILVGFTSSMIACNTTEGAGQDMQSAGRSIEKAADQNK
jgi:predicted small secreted protein